MKSGRGGLIGTSIWGYNESSIVAADAQAPTVIAERLRRADSLLNVHFKHIQASLIVTCELNYVEQQQPSSSPQVKREDQRVFDIHFAHPTRNSTSPRNTLLH